jgi:hypothetical protein
MRAIHRSDQVFPTEVRVVLRRAKTEAGKLASTANAEALASAVGAASRRFAAAGRDAG